jgi:hypothetical protein
VGRQEIKENSYDVANLMATGFPRD